jgi:hypothetical protein
MQPTRVRDCSGNPLRLPSGRDWNGKRGITPQKLAAKYTEATTMLAVRMALFLIY